MRDYLALLRPQPEDLKQHGILGMKWGRRRSEAQLVADTAKRKSSGEDVTPTKKAASVTPTHDSDGVETSASRYARLTGEAKGGGATNWSEQDLKFYNARTEALAKVNKMYQSDPSWLRSTSKTVLQQAAKNTMQSISNGVAQKYISGPLLEALNDKSASVKAETSTPIDYVGRHRAKQKN
jgi:hypothetical protein